MTYTNARSKILNSVFLLTLLCLSGCSWSQPGSSSTAHIVIKSATQDQIHDELIRVFEYEDYNLDESNPGYLVFSRPATQADIILFGEFLTTDMKMRVDVKIEEYRTTQHLVLADVYVIMDGSVDRKLGLVGRRHYQSLLKRTRANLVNSGTTND